MIEHTPKPTRQIFSTSKFLESIRSHLMRFLGLRYDFQDKYFRLSLITFLALMILFLSGSIVTHFQIREACSSWPLCIDGQLLPQSFAQTISMVHRLLVVITAGLLLFQWKRSWVIHRDSAGIVVSATLMLVLFLSQAVLGAKLVQGFPWYLLVLHRITAVSVAASAFVHLFYLGRLKDESIKTDEASQKYEWSFRILKDMLILTKPVVVALLLVTTFAGMVIGGGELPSLRLTFWTLLGGFFAAGGAGAINQVLDRKDDEKMQRTQKRPIPAGRLTPAQGIAFGAGLTILSFYIYVGKVNLLAAILSLAGFFYYVVIYSLWLKKATPQNIVIGGGAGAIPPLVGWAAATGSLNVPAIFLFVLVFMWTPPHFWALAIVRRQDYARAGVPMLPVVKGEQEARRQIFIYTLELVALTLLMPLGGLGGWLYFVGALLLGVWLVHTAWKVWKVEGNKVAWKMYRYSSIYLALLFVVMMADAVI